MPHARLGRPFAAGVPVARITPGVGVELESGERIAAPVLVSNADPRTTLRLLDRHADAGWRAQVDQIPMESVTAKVNMTLRELPNFTARGPERAGTIATPEADQHAAHEDRVGPWVACRARR